MASEPWYQEGLAFSCVQCGNCCIGASGAVWVNDEEIVAIASYLGVPVGEMRLLRTRLVGSRVSLTEHLNGDCTFFDPETCRCRIYPVRPRQCRSWPFSDSNLASPETWNHVQTTCPGAGHGSLIRLQDIRSLAGLIRL